MLAAFIPAACPDRRDRDQPERLIDSPGVITVHVAGVGMADASRWTSVPEFSTLGIDSLQLGGGESLFARFLSDGSLVIANGDRIIRLGPDGSFLKVLARSGDGPGEVRVVVALGIAEDGSLFAADHLSGRLVQLTPDGALLRMVRRLRPFSDGTQVSPLAVLSDGRTLAVPWQWQAARAPSPGRSGARLARDPVAVVTFDKQGEVLDTIAVLPGLERADGLVAPFPKSAVYSGRGRRWVAGVSDSVDLTVYDGTVPNLRLVGQRAASPVTDRQRSQRDSAVMAQFGREVGGALLQRQANLAQSATPPDIGGVLIDAAGRLWVGGYVVPGETQRPWTIYSRRGEPVGRLSLPAFDDVLLPARTELLDATAERLALIRESPDGDIVIEVRRITEK